MKTIYLADVDTMKNEIREYMRRSLTPNEDQIIAIVERNTFVKGE